MIEVINKDNSVIGYIDITPRPDTCMIKVPVVIFNNVIDYKEYPYVYKDDSPFIAIQVSEKDMSYLERLTNYKSIKDFS